MDRLPSSEFRKTYQRLTEPTEVTVNGHVIGQWIPGTAWERALAEPSFVAALDQGRADLAAGRVRPMTQADRDRILHRINKGG